MLSEKFQFTKDLNQELITLRNYNGKFGMNKKYISLSFGNVIDILFKSQCTYSAYMLIL